MKKAVLMLAGVLLALFAFAQALQAMGLIGTKITSLPGIALIAIGTAGSLACFQKARGKPTKRID